MNNKRRNNKVIDELIAHEDNKPIRPKLSFVKFEDGTPEGVMQSLCENVPNAMQSSSEGGNILNTKASAKTGQNNSFWSGDRVSHNTKTDGEMAIVDGRLTMNIMVQPTALQKFLKKSSTDVRGNGFLSRYLVCAPISTCGGRYEKGIKSTSDNIKAFNTKVAELLSEASELKDYTNRKTIRLSSKAKAIWIEVFNDVEYKMGGGGMYQYARDHASKLLEIIGRLAALLHCFEYSMDEDISSETLLEAINIVAYFSGQFMKVFCAPPKYVTDAENLKGWFGGYVNSGRRYLKKNDILKFGPSGTRKKASLDAALGYLKSNWRIGEFLFGRTMVIDLLPTQQIDEAVIRQELTIKFVF
ncbi:DUF3987 domain-containing protein [Thalassotalea castellviae]|uniref:DUF3987 domain-containing protein n=1 Tax=Thalassotalea castellviae TaxID=3075612 RepID=A0ABU2ZX89_9GAMM|nr:DUF3987 domain-containing protein [Thalassotalea sp. W431]MDT0602542.1 DUF3987 domain-containing protein [Thalassotalea sp. W431]